MTTEILAPDLEAWIFALCCETKWRHLTILSDRTATYDAIKKLWSSPTSKLRITEFKLGAHCGRSLLLASWGKAHTSISGLPLAFPL